MATAGRILILPKGKWDSDATYEHLDLVAHDGRSWLAKKVSTGIEPSEDNVEYWHDLLGVGVLPDTGGTLKGDLYLKKTNKGYTLFYKNHSETIDYGTYVLDFNEEGKRVGLVLSATRNDVEFKDNDGDEHILFGEHNKPSKDYTGDGSTSEKTIATGGIGHFAVIWSDGTDKVTLLTPWGGFVKEGATVRGLERSKARIQNGTVYCATDDVALNASGIKYHIEIH